MHQIFTSIRGLDWTFIRGSSMNSLGIAFARVLGFAFSFVVAQAFSSDEYGRVVYTITLASIVAVLSQPFGQHIIAYFVGLYREDDKARDEVLATAWTLWLAITLLTVLISTPILLAANRFSPELLTVYIGVTVFYAYYGAASGLLASGRLLAAYLGSNIVQILLVILVVNVFDAQNGTTALYAYGLSYFLPLAVLIFFFPLPLHLKLGFNPAYIRQLLGFATSIWISHILYVGYVSSDILLLEHFQSESAVGVYTLTKTLSSAFHFIPGGITMTLMPKIAGMPKEGHRSVINVSLLVTIVVNAVGGTLYMLLYQWFVVTYFGAEYFVSLNFGLMMALAAILMGIHGVITSFFVGGGRTSLQPISRIIMMVSIIGLGFLLIPRQGVMGAAMANLISSITGVVFYAFVPLYDRLTKRSVEQDTAVDNSRKG